MTHLECLPLFFAYGDLCMLCWGFSRAPLQVPRESRGYISDLVPLWVWASKLAHAYFCRLQILYPDYRNEEK